MLYINGDINRLTKLYGDFLSNGSWTKFSARNLFRLEANDVFLTVRACDSVAKFYACSVISERPVILQLADGHISELNCERTEDPFTGTRLYRPLLCDLFVTFNGCAPNIFNKVDVMRVRHVRPAFAHVDNSTSCATSKSNSWVIASGNDPFFSPTYTERVISAFRNVARHAESRRKRVVYSVVNHQLRASLMKNGESLPSRSFQEILKMQPAPEMLFTTPSTIALEAVAQGMRVCIINCWPSDVNFPRELTWNVANEGIEQTLARVRNSYNRMLTSSFFGSMRLEDIILKVIRHPSAHKVDLSESARSSRIPLSTIIGSLL